MSAEPLTVNDCELIVQLLDRVSITGHQERAAMNQTVDKILRLRESLANPPEIPDPDA